jgi:hypothetical protein
MNTPTRVQPPRGGRDHRNPRPASIGTGGRFRSESPAEIVGIRIQADWRRHVARPHPAQWQALPLLRLELRGLLRAPAIIVRAWRAVRQKGEEISEGEVREAPERLDPLLGRAFPR